MPLGQPMNRAALWGKLACRGRAEEWLVCDHDDWPVPGTQLGVHLSRFKADCRWRNGMVRSVTMNIRHRPLLQIQRDLHEKPRTMERFYEYLRTIFGGDVSEENDTPQLVPLIAMNPMGRTHVNARLDQLLALGAEEIAADAVAEAEERLSPLFAEYQGDYQHGLVIIDDLGGAWSNRFVLETGRFAAVKLDKYRWFSSGIFVSDEPTATRIRQNVLSGICRTLYLDRHGAPKTLPQMLVQEGQVGSFAGITPQLDAEDLAYSREIIQPYLNSDHYPTCLAAMLGDEAARTLGYQPLGLSPYAGIAVAIADFAMTI